MVMLMFLILLPYFNSQPHEEADAVCEGAAY